MITRIKGVSFNNINPPDEYRQDIIEELLQKGLLQRGTELVLQRQPDNPYDSNAIAIFSQGGKQLGYVDRNLASVYAEIMDKGYGVKAYVNNVLGGEDEYLYGVEIKIQIYINISI